MGQLTWVKIDPVLLGKSRRWRFYGWRLTEFAWFG